MSTEKIIMNIVSETLKIPENQVKPEDKLTDLVSDSIQLFELLMRFEKELGKKINYEDIANVESIADIIQYANKIGFKPAVI